MCKKVRPLCTALTFRLVSWPVKHHMLHTIKHKSYSKANCFGMFGEQSIRISKTWHTVPLHLPAKSPGRSIQPCKHPQLRLQNFSNLYVTDKWLGVPDLSFFRPGKIWEHRRKCLSFFWHFFAIGGQQSDHHWRQHRVGHLRGTWTQTQLRRWVSVTKVTRP